MTAAWLASFFRLAALDTVSLRALLATLRFLDIGAAQRDAIQIELAARATAAWVEERLERCVCVWTERGGKS